VCLEAETPARVFQTVANSKCGVPRHIRPVHGLKVEVLKVPVFEVFWWSSLLREDQLEFVARA
jgi:hypothetical protein